MKRFTCILLFFTLLSSQLQAQHVNETLKQLIQKGFEKSYDEQINKQQSLQISLDRQSAKNVFLPHISGNIAYTHLNDDLRLSPDFENLLLGSEKLLIKEHLNIPFNTPLPASVPVKPIAPIQEQNLFTISGNAQWVLFSGGKVHYGLKALQHQQNAIDYMSEKEKTKIALEITDLYDKLALLIASGNVLKASENYLIQQKKFVETAIINGLATPLERQKIELAQQRLATRQLELTNNKQLLLEKMQQLTNEDLQTLQSLQPVLSAIMLDTAIASQQRAEIKMLDEAIAATNYKYKMELTEYVPKVAAIGHYEFRKQAFTMPSAVPTWFVGVGMQWNMFDGFAARNKARKAQADKNMYALQKAEAEELISLSNTKATLELKMSYQKIQMIKQQVELSEKNLFLSDKQFKNGLTNITEYLNSVMDVEKSNFDLHNAYYDQRRAVFALLEAKGVLVTYLLQ